MLERRVQTLVTVLSKRSIRSRNRKARVRACFITQYADVPTIKARSQRDAGQSCGAGKACWKMCIGRYRAGSQGQPGFCFVKGDGVPALRVGINRKEVLP